MKVNSKVISILNCIFLVFTLCGCKKFVEVDGPTTSVSSKNIFSNDATAIGAVTSLYVNLSSSLMFGGPGELKNLSCIAGLSADELDYYSGAPNNYMTSYYQNDLTPLNVSGGSDYWGRTFQRIFVVNSAIEGLIKHSGLTTSVKTQLLGEVMFMRAFYYFYLVNLYGDVPIVLTTDYLSNSVIKKSNQSEVYTQIIKDLNEAKTLLSDRYLKGDIITPYLSGVEERIRPTKWAAIALLARVYLYNNDWINSQIQSSLVIENTTQFQLQPLDKVFFKNSSEAIWQLQPVQNGANTQEANMFVLPAEGPTDAQPVYLNAELFKAFELDDLRRTKWIGSVNINGITYYYPNKYKIRSSPTPNAPVIEYSTIMRLAELYLIRAESRIHLNNLDGAVEDIDQIRKRAGLRLIKTINPTITNGELLVLIFNEKRLELFTEWGHRWLDLKRTGQIDEVMNKVTPLKSKGGSWKSYQQFYPIWSYELLSNPALAQTQGY